MFLYAGSDCRLQSCGDECSMHLPPQLGSASHRRARENDVATGIVSGLCNFTIFFIDGACNRKQYGGS